MVDLRSGAATDVGRVREVNEDSWLASPPVFVVADGMGGHHGGDVASGIVVEEFGHLVRDGRDRGSAREAVTGCLADCQRRIHEFADDQDPDDDWYAGTTVVAAVLDEGDDGPTWLLVNLGDSRIYRVVDGELEQVSVDHSRVQELLDSGAIDEEQSARHPERHVVTRALGGPTLPEPDVFVLPVAEARRLVLVSDGVSNMLGHAVMTGIVVGVEDPQDAAERLVAEAVAAGGEDNATAVVVDVVG